MVKEILVKPDFTPKLLNFNSIPCFQYQGSLKDELGKRLDKEKIILMFKTMLLIRYFEEMIVELKSGKFTPLKDFKFVGATHLSIGQEAVATGVMARIKKDDYITSTHRGHGHAIAKGLWALFQMNEKELCNFLNVKCSNKSKENLLEQAIDLHLLKTVGELFGKDIGYCHGKGGGMHIADFNVGHLGANAIVGGSFAIATGAALAEYKLKRGRVVVCFVGDGALHNGISLEAMNFAAQKQFGPGLPIIYAIENNQYAMTGQTVGEVTGVDYLARRGAGISTKNMNAEVINGMNVLAVYDAIDRSIEKINNDSGPILLEFITYRYKGHSLSDSCTKYRTQEEEKQWLEIDPINTLKRELIDCGVLSEEEIETIQSEIKNKIHNAAIKAAKSDYPDPKTIYDGLMTDTIETDIPDEYKKVEVIKDWTPFRRDSQGRIMYRHAVREALAEEMLRDRRVILYGEDVADYGGAFQATAGLFETFGRERVFNAPISEAAIVGTACGAAMAGLRPVAEIMYIDFILLAMDQLGNQVAKTRYMFGGKAEIPMVLRTTIGGGKGYAGQHSQSLEAVITHFPGLKVVAPSTAYDVKGLLKMSIRDNNPVVFIEHQLLYSEKDVVPESEYLLPLGKSVVRKEGKDITIISYSYMMLNSIEAANHLEEEGISAEVIDLRTLIPLDIDTIVNSAKKTGRVMVVCQAPEIGCFGEHVLYEIQSNAFDHLKAPLKVVGARNVPPPMAPTLEYENIPSVERIVDEAKLLINR